MNMSTVEETEKFYDEFKSLFNSEQAANLLDSFRTLELNFLSFQRGLDYNCTLVGDIPTEKLSEILGAYLASQVL